MGRSKPRILILIPTFQPNDAVGNDVLGMYHMLTGAGFETKVLAQYVHPAFESITTILGPDSDPLFRDPGTILIYHHAILWELGEEILARAKNKVVIKYHNVTPPEFFSGYADHYYWACVRGREATARLARRPGVWIWGDSQYNTDECVALGADPARARVLAPIHRIEDLGRQPFDSVVLGAYRDASTANILFVGGMRPNKGHAKAAEVLAALHSETGQPVRLFFVGSLDPNLSRYMDDVQQYLKHLDLAGDVVFAPSVSPAQLRSYYMLASVFLCVSEHEGFCVPLVEAMAFRVPIVAWATTAVGETVGEAGLVYDRFDPDAMAAAIAGCLDDQSLACDLASRGRRRYENVFHNDAIRRRLLSLVEEVASL